MPRTTVKTCTVCGESFIGAFRAKYCPECRPIQKAKQAEATRKRRASGASRKIGSTDICAQCGAIYIVNAGMQQYCRSCADARHKARNSSLMRYYYAKKERVAALPDEDKEALRLQHNKKSRDYYRKRMEADSEYRKKLRKRSAKP